MMGRIIKLEASHGGQTNLAHLTDEELKDRIRALVAKGKGCKPEEVELDFSPEALKAGIAATKAAIAKRGHLHEEYDGPAYKARNS